MRTRNRHHKSPPRIQSKTTSQANKSVTTQTSGNDGEQNFSNKDSKEKLEELYSNIKSTPSFTAKLGDFLRQHNVHSQHRRIVKKRFPRRRVIAKCPFDLMMADLIEYRMYKRQNKGYSYILLVIDAFSKVVYTAPMKHKDANSTFQAFESIFDNFTEYPINLCTDEGKEFFNSKVQSLFLMYGINHYAIPTKSLSKASIAERAIRTIKQRLQKYFGFKKNNRWVDVIDQVTLNYNNTPHRSIGMAPLEVNGENRDEVYKRLYPYRKLTVVCRLKLGDKVRKIKEKSIFEKGYTANWSEEIFIIDKVSQSNAVCWYRIKTLDNKPVKGIFYYYQLNLVSSNDN